MGLLRSSRPPKTRKCGNSSAAYRTGRGAILMRAKASIEQAKKGDKQSIVVTEIPYQVNKARLIEKIAELVGDKTIEGISDLRDESDREGMRVVIRGMSGSAQSSATRGASAG